eukprot:760256-Hanusia_phi.AAC.1
MRASPRKRSESLGDKEEASWSSASESNTWIRSPSTGGREERSRSSSRFQLGLWSRGTTREEVQLGAWSGRRMRRASETFPSSSTAETRQKEEGARSACCPWTMRSRGSGHCWEKRRAGRLRPARTERERRRRRRPRCWSSAKYLDLEARRRRAAWRVRAASRTGPLRRGRRRL